MSTTLMPPSYYVVKSKGQPARTYRTVAEAAAAAVEDASLAELTIPSYASMT
jgi:hypothetical protein